MELEAFPIPRDTSVGLTSELAQSRLAESGPNRIAAEPTRSRLLRLLGPLKDPMVILLILATPIYMAIGDKGDALTTVIAIVPIVAIGWFLESRAQRSLDKLREISAPQVVVWRDGRNQLINAEHLVVDDVYWLHEGDVVAADATVIESTQLSVNESALTGESLPVVKTVSLNELASENRVFAGTTVTAGRALVRTSATGMDTEFGRIGSLLAQTSAPRTPLQIAMAALVFRIAAVAVVFTVAVIAIEIVRGHGLAAALIAGISLMIAAIPEEFSVVYALYLSIGAWRLAQDKALVRNLPGAEALGSVTVICTDKTGTLTEGRLVVAGITALTNDVHLLEAAVRACEPQALDQLDVAILDHAARAGLDVHVLHGGELVADWPFTADGNYVSHVWRHQDGSHSVSAKGSFEGIVERSNVSPEELTALTVAHDNYAKQGMRVIAIAMGSVTRPSNERATDENALALLGVIAFQDPVRPEIPAAIAASAAAGIRTIMITGDHPDTARAIALDMGQLPHRDTQLRVTTGLELKSASIDERRDLVERTDVFARTTPEQKYELVQELRTAGEVVAMTGDGINDAPALRAADIGIAMGIRGTSVAREAATIVLLDDNFASIVTATRNGRRIYDNLSKAFGFLIAVHIPIITVAVLFPLIGKPLLLQPIHLVLLEVVLHPIVSLVFQAEPAARNIMTRPPRPANYALTLKALATPIITGLCISAAVAGMYMWGLTQPISVDRARGIAFISLLAAQPFLMMSLHSPSRPFWLFGTRFTKQLVGAVFGVVAMIAAIQFIPAVTRFFKLDAISSQQLISTIAAGFIAIAIPELLKFRRTR